jgi:outer membrane protein assembly factor BamB/PKD repeat protein
MSSRRRRSVPGIRIVGKLGAVIFVSLLIASIFAGIMPVAAQAPTESVAVPDEYGAIMDAVNATSSGLISMDMDSDGDGISDYDEINGFTWGDTTYFTNPYMASTDRDPYNDYMEITGINMPTAATDPGRHPCVPSSPDFEIDLEEINYETICEISTEETIAKGTESTVGGESSETWSIEEGFESSISITDLGVGSHVTWGLEFSWGKSWSTSTSSSQEWGKATAVDPSEAAKLKFRMRVRNNGTDAAKNVKLRFNIMIGEENIADTIWTDVIEWRIEPGEVSDEMVISKDKDGNDIIISLNELKSIECGIPITIKVTEINAEVPWEDGWITWSDHQGEIEPVSSTIIYDFGNGDVRTYYVWSGIHLVGSAPHPYIHNITLMDAIDRTVGVEDREDGLYIGGKKYEEGWAFSFDTDAFETVNNTLSGLPDPSIFDLLNITIAQGWTLIIKTAPDTEPPVIHWASYSEDRKTIAASVSDNLNVRDVKAHVYAGYYRDIKLKDEDGDGIFTATLSEEITDKYDDYVTATDDKFVSIKNDIRLIPYWWPMFNHDTSHTGSSLSDAPDNDNLLWSYKTGAGVFSSPAVADGRVFVGSRDGYIYCLDENTGSEKWKYMTGDQVESSPAVVDGRVFIGSNDHYIYCLNETNGEKLWSYKTGADVFSSPAVADGRVFVGSGDGDGRIYCLDEDTGVKIWSRQIGWGVWSSPAVADGKVFVGSSDNKVYCLRETNGETIWSYPTSGSVDPSLAVADGKVFVGSYDDKKVYCLDVHTGTELWNFTTGGNVGSSPAVADGRVYVGSHDSTIYCLDEDTGEKLWSRDLGGVIFNSPAVADDKVFVTTGIALMCLYDSNGYPKWGFSFQEPWGSSPAVADGKVFVGSYDNYIYCLGSPGLSQPTATIKSISPDRAVQEEDIITFEGKGTDNGNVVAYQWKSTIDGVINSSESFSIAASELSVGTHSIFFKVRDNDGLWSTQEVGYVTVKAPNTPPVVFFIASPDYPVINEAILFNASASYDSGGLDGIDQFIKIFTWDFGDGTTATGKVVTHAYSEAGNYNVTLNVTDYYGLTNETTLTVSVYRGNVDTNEVGVTSTITVDSPSTLAAFLPDEYNDTDISHAIVLNVNVTDSTPGNGTDDAYVDITTNVGDMDVETCKVFKAGFGFLPEVDDVTALPTVSGNSSFSRDVANETVTVRLYAGDPLLGVVPPEEKEPTPTPTPTPPPRGGGGGGGLPLDSDGDGYTDIMERLMGTIHSTSTNASHANTNGNTNGNTCRRSGVS